MGDREGEGEGKVHNRDRGYPFGKGDDGTYAGSTSSILYSQK